MSCFEKMQYADREKLLPYLESFRYIDIGFASLYYSAETFGTEYGFPCDAFCLRMNYPDGRRIYITRDFERLEQTANELCATENGTVIFDFVPKERLDAFSELNGYECEYEYNELYSDYFCTYEDYCALKKSAAPNKYKDYNQFCKRFSHNIEVLGHENLHTARFILDEWCAPRDCGKCVYGCEKKWILRILDAWDELGVKGLLVYAEEKPAAFNIAEQNGDTLLKLVAKSIGRQVGLNVFMGVEAAVRLFPDAKYVNLGADSGISGLKRFKSKFLPYTKLDKYTVTLKKL